MGLLLQYVFADACLVAVGCCCSCAMRHHGHVYLLLTSHMVLPTSVLLLVLGRSSSSQAQGTTHCYGGYGAAAVPR
jgi:hypothetical protein